MAEEAGKQQSNISSSALGGPSFRLQEYSLMLANKHINELLESLQAGTSFSQAMPGEYLRVKQEIQHRIDSLKRGAAATATLGDSLSAVVAAAAAGQARIEEQKQQRQAATKKFHNHHHHPQEQSNTDSTPAFFIPAGSTKIQQQPMSRDANRSAVAAATAPKTAGNPDRLSTTSMKPSVLRPAAAGRSDGGCGNPSGDHLTAKSVADSDKERQQHGSSGGIKQPPPPAKKTVRYMDVEDCSVKQASAPAQTQPQRLTATETSAEVQRHQTCPRTRNTYSSSDHEDDEAEDDADDESSSVAPATYSASATLSSHEMITISSDSATASSEGSRLGRRSASLSPSAAPARQCCISSQTTIAIRLNSSGSGQKHDSTNAATCGVDAEGPTSEQQLAQTKTTGTRMPTASTATTATNSGSNSSSESCDEAVALDRASTAEPCGSHPQFNLSAALWGGHQEQQKQQAARTAAAESKEPPQPAAVLPSPPPPSRTSTLPPQTLLVMPSGAAEPAAPSQTIPRDRQRCHQRNHHQQQQQHQPHRPQQQLLQQRLRRCRRYLAASSAGSRARISLCGATCTNASTQTCTYLPCDSFASRKATSRSQSLYYLAAIRDPDSFALGTESVGGCCWRVSRKQTRDSAASAVVLRHCEAFNSVTVGPPIASQACATLVSTSTRGLHRLELHEALQLPSETWLEQQQQQLHQQEHQVTTSCTHVAPAPPSPARHCPSCTEEPALVLRHHRSDCRLHERLSATALLFATDSEETVVGRGRGATALLTRLSYPEDVQLLAAAVAATDAAAAAAGNLSKVQTACWSLVPSPPTSSATAVVVRRARIAAAAVRVAASGSSDSWGRRDSVGGGDSDDDDSDDDCNYDDSSSDF